MNLIVPKKPSAPVESLDEIKDIAAEMKLFLEGGHYGAGLKKVAIALHHSQIDPENPKNFFVVRNSAIGAKGNELIVIANAKILEKDPESYKIVSEGCMSFPFRHDVGVRRAMRIKVSYQVPERKLKVGPFTLATREEWVEGVFAQVFQHENLHAHGQNIYQMPHGKVPRFVPEPAAEDDKKVETKKEPELKKEKVRLCKECGINSRADGSSRCKKCSEKHARHG